MGYTYGYNQIILYSIFSYIKTKFFLLQLSELTIPVCSFLQSRVWLGLKHFFQVPITMYTMNFNSCSERLCGGIGQTLRKEDSWARLWSSTANYLCMTYRYKNNSLSMQSVSQQLVNTPASNLFVN